MIDTAPSPARRAAGSLISWPVPGPRRFTVVLGVLASAGIAATSLRAAPAGVLYPVTAAWLLLFAAGALWRRRGPLMLTAVAVVTRVITVACIVWVIVSPHSPIGPRDWLDWVPIGSLEAATGIWLLRVIRRQAR